MVSLQEYSYLSEVVYNVGRNRQNLLESKVIGWVEMEYKEQGDHDSDFSAEVYSKDDEIVIAFTGTNNRKVEC